MKFIINRKTLISMLFIAITMLGYISYRQLPYELIPNTELPVLIVSVSSQGGADPLYLEHQGVIPVENAVSSLENIENIESVINRNQGLVFVYYNEDVDTKFAYLKLQEKMNQLRHELPDGFSLNVTRMNMENYNYRLMNLLVLGDGDINRIRKIAEEEIVSQIENIDGIASVEVFGGRKKSVVITLNDALCKSHNITISEVNAAIMAQGIEKTFVGTVYDQNKRYFINVEYDYRRVKDIANIPLGKDNLSLHNIADIYFGFPDEDSRSRTNGKESVSMVLQRDPQSNMIALSGQVKQEITALNETLKTKGIEILIQQNQAEQMENNLDQIVRLSLIGGILAIIVLWGFLKNIRIILVIALAIPISVYASFNIFYAFGISVNNFTMVGMILAIGMLLDNSVVVLENIYNMRSRGMNSMDATIQGTKEVMRPVIAATLTTVVVFLPFLYSSNFFMKIYGANVGISIISTLSISLLAALLLVPMVTHSILKRNEKRGIAYFEDISIKNPLIHRYVVLLKSCLRRPALTILGSIFISLIVWAISQVNTSNNLEEVEQTSLTMYVKAPNGSILDETDKMVREVESRLMEREEIEEINSRVDEETGVITIQLKKNYEEDFNTSYPSVKNQLLELNKEIKGAEVSYSPPARSGGGGGGGRFSGMNRGNQGLMRFLGIGEESERMVVKGSDIQALQATAHMLKNRLDEMDAIDRVTIESDNDLLTMNLQFDEAIISEYEIPLNNVLSELTVFSNQVNSQMKLKTDNDEFDIVIKTSNDTLVTKDKNVDDLKRLNVNNNQGASFKLDEISEMYTSRGVGDILRVNQEKQIEISYRFESEIEESNSLKTDAREEVENMLSQLNLTEGVVVEILYDESSVSQFRPLIIIAILLIYMVLASIFESFLSPFIIMLTIPLAFVGAFIAVSLTGNSIGNSNVMMGLLILLGIVVNNGIILIDYINLLQKKGYSRQRAIITAGISRVRPIFITAITTIIAMLPLAMGKSEYLGSIGAPFAITVIGGLTISSLLTLIFIPTFYSGLHSVINWINSLRLSNRLIQLFLLAALVTITILYVETLIFKILFVVLEITAIPAFTYLIMNSLRLANTYMIGDDKSIHIKIQNLVKVYDNEKRFQREWRYGKRFTQQYALMEKGLSWRYLGFLIWQLPLLAFILYFTYVYVNKNLWEFILSFMVFFYLRFMIKPFAHYFHHRAKQKGKTRNRWMAFMQFSLYWFYPIPHILWFKNQWNNIVPAIIVGAIWYILLWFSHLGNKIYAKNMNLQRLKGRFKRIRFFIYNLVVHLPLIGKKRKPFKALKAVSLEIGTGMFGLLGPNGAGKSTLMKTICGIINQSYGKIFINEYDTLKYREELQGLIGYLPQEFGMYENMTAYNYLDYMAILKNIGDAGLRKERVDYVLTEVNMMENAHDKIGSFSGGMKQRIGIAQILLHLPRILVVDEPTAGIDPRERIRFRNLLIEQSRNRIIIFSTHIIEDISSSCNKVAVLNRGEVKYMGNPREMTRIAEGRVWQFFVHVDDFEQTYHQFKVVNHMRDGDQVRIRCVAAEKPVEGAENIQPNLEDAYLWLQSN